MTPEEELLKSFKAKMGIRSPEEHKKHWQSKTIEEVAGRYFMDPAKRPYLDRHTFGALPKRERSQDIAHLHKHVHSGNMSASPVKISCHEETSPGNLPTAPRSLKGARGTHFRPQNIKNIR